MTDIPDEEVEAVARTLVRQAILASGWYPKVDDVERQNLIEADVNLHWRVMIADARKHLEQQRHERPIRQSRSG
jgi:hypothetical protein